MHHQMGRHISMCVHSFFIGLFHNECFSFVFALCRTFILVHLVTSYGWILREQVMCGDHLHE